MIEQVGNTLLCFAKFEDTDGSGVTGLTDIVTYAWTVTVTETPSLDITTSVVHNGVNQTTAAMEEVGRGVYVFPILAASVPSECVLIFQCESPNASVANNTSTGVWVVGKAGVEKLDAAVSAIETDTQDIQNRIPAALVSGRMSSDAVAISGSTTAADDVEANISRLDVASSTLATAAELTALGLSVSDVFNTLDARLPGTLSSGRIRAQIEGMGAGVLTASALASDAVDEIVDQNWRELLPDHVNVANSFAQYISSIWSYLSLYVKPQTDKLQFGAGNDIKATLDGETVTVGTNNDKTGYDLTTPPATVAEIKTGLEISGGHLDSIKGTVEALPTDHSDVLTAMDDLETHGDTVWATATGFSTLTTGDLPAAPDNTGIAEAKAAAEASQTLLASITEDSGGTRLTEHALSALTLSLDELEAIQAVVWAFQQSGQDISTYMANALNSILAKTNLITGALPSVRMPEVMDGTVVRLLEFGDYFQVNWPVPEWNDGPEWPADLAGWTASVYVQNTTTEATHTFPAEIIDELAPGQQIIWEVSKDDLDEFVGLSPNGRVIHRYALLLTNTASGHVITGATGNLKRTTFG